MIYVKEQDCPSQNKVLKHGIGRGLKTVKSGVKELALNVVLQSALLGAYRLEVQNVSLRWKIMWNCQKKNDLGTEIIDQS